MFVIDLVALFAMAYLLIEMLGIIQSAYEKLALSLAAGLGIKTLFLFGLITFGIKPEIVIQTALSVCGLAAAGAARHLKFKYATPAPVDKPGATPTIAIIIITGLFILSVANALFFPITEGDGIWYEVRGRLLFHEHRFDLGVFHYTYPPLVHLLYAYLHSINVEKLKIIFPAFYLCLLIVFYHRIHAHHKNQKLASVFTITLATTPYFWWHSILPFLNLVSGFYFSLAAIYWFFLVRSLSEDSDDSPDMVPLALLSGFFFGLASWTRMEFVVYGVIPLAGLAYVLEQRTGFDRKQKNKILLPFAGLTLGIPSAWLLTVLTFKEHEGVFVGGAMVVCALGWVFVLTVAFDMIKINRKNLPMIFVSGCLVFIAAIAWRYAAALPWALFSAVYRTVFFNAFYLFTAGLVFFVLAGGLKSLGVSEKILGGFIVSYILLHFAIYSFTGSKWPTMRENFDAVFIHPGNAVNVSGTREMLAIYPVFIFFISCLPRIRGALRTIDFRKTRYVLYLVPVLNVLVLATFFVVPRVQFMVSHARLTSAELMETRGPSDMPNPYYEAYKLLNRVREATDDSATIFFPPLNSAHQSIPTQRLHPRKFFWGDFPGYQENLEKRPRDSYFVTHPGWYPEYCDGKPQVNLNDSGYSMCRLDEAK